MKFIPRILAFVSVACLGQFAAIAQPGGLLTDTITTAPAVHTNTAIIPVSRTGAATNRQSRVLQRARENPGD